MLEVGGKPILQNALDILRSKGIADISIIKGYQKEKINFSGITYFENPDFLVNNILHSLLFARAKMEEAIAAHEEIIVSYADIWYTPEVLHALTEDHHDFSLVVDEDWLSSYGQRKDHPVSEAEKALFKEDDRIVQIGKKVVFSPTSKNCGEFIGLCKFTPRGMKNFLHHFDRINGSRGKTAPFQKAAEWQKSYLTDLFQEMIDSGESLYTVKIKKNWKEFDTMEDYLNAESELSPYLKKLRREAKP